MGTHDGFERFENVDVLGECCSVPFAVTGEMADRLGCGCYQE